MDHVHKLVRYALADASRQGIAALGVTTLVKLVYLADLEHASRKGTPYTDTAWRFLHFGPWAPTIQDALPRVGAEAVALLDRPDVHYWKLALEPPDFSALDASLPVTCTAAISGALRKFRGDDAGLLDYVYRTAPMLKATPGELLSLSSSNGKPPEPPRLLEAPLTKKQRRQLDDLKQRIQARLKARPAGRELVAPDPPPNYDAEFREGVAWLNALEAQGEPPVNGTAKVSEDIWRSRGRTDLEDIP